jgi:uncharacterized membrane protein YebE (DUF533 family)
MPTVVPDSLVKPNKQEFIQDAEIVKPPKGKDVQLTPNDEAINQSIEKADIEALSRSGGVSVTSTSTPEAKKTRVHWLELGLLALGLGALGWAVFHKDQKEQAATQKKKEEPKKETVDGVPKGAKSKKPAAKKTKGKYEIQGFVK